MQTFTGCRCVEGYNDLMRAHTRSSARLMSGLTSSGFKSPAAQPHMCSRLTATWHRLRELRCGAKHGSKAYSLRPWLNH